MIQIDKTKPVMVSGATGYVAGWLVKKLLDEGLTVHAAVRNPDNREKLKVLDELANQSSGTIKYFKSDLLDEGSYAEAMEGCELVFHTASPFTLSVNDPQKELVEPALLGTRNVLEQANRTESVKRVVLTSSVAAIYGDNIDIKNTANGIFTEEDWNTSSSLTHGAYPYSKTLAEKEAWKINREQSRWDLVVINPSLVMGPAVNPQNVTSESYAIIKQIADGTLKAGVPYIGWGVVDVRDVAEAHFQAGFVSTASGRHIVSGHNTTFLGLSNTLLPKYGNAYPIPKKEMPKWLIWLVGPMLNKALTRKYISRNVGYGWKADSKKSIRELGIQYRSLEETVNEMFEQLVEADVL
ncbi:NAD-dependent epimerase/dehydratase family protein [Carboxylicivirga sediminis]|uniref:NAD-dependent epimerase/dehydratase family protein n=1 Tax=Carboxylicivirga sediminis TaxID=2006564 RepID=A0A941F6V3_9BACT|nr:NAD-dependent epimerase/dehydratase family protein [Carboxylicivirga sediminis]MBR8537828.1 NAD-dependent epimerase/dehydratase family protein [Carboxylicivirga sediminis]